MSLIRDSTTTKTGAIFLVSEFQGADDFSDRQATLIVDLDDIRFGINILRLFYCDCVRYDLYCIISIPFWIATSEGQKQNIQIRNAW